MPVNGTNDVTKEQCININAEQNGRQSTTEIRQAFLVSACASNYNNNRRRGLPAGVVFA